MAALDGSDVSKVLLWNSALPFGRAHAGDSAGDVHYI